MGTQIDDKVVAMTFDNAVFERRIAQTIQSLGGLKTQIDNVSKPNSQALDGLIGSVGRIEQSVGHVSRGFSAMGAVAFTAIQGATRAAFGLVTTLKNVVFDPLVQGGKQRAMNIEQAKFQFRGLGIDVDKAMASSLAAVKGTAYGLDEAAKAAAQFGASGINAGSDMTAALRGIAGAAAMTGSSFTDISQIFTSMAGEGKVTNQRLMEFGSRGLNAAAAVGKVMGKSEKQIHEMATNGTLDFKTFALAMDQAFGKHATEANQTYAGSLANLKAAMSRVGAAFQGPLLDQKRDVFNALSDAIDKAKDALGPLIDAFTYINGISSAHLVDWIKNLNFDKFKVGLFNVIHGVTSLINLVKAIAGPIKLAFRDIFPKKSVGGLLKFTDSFAKFAASLKFGLGGFQKIRAVAGAFFSVLSIGWTIVKEAAKAVVELFAGLTHGGKGVASAGAGIAGFIVHLRKFLVEGGGIHRFFTALVGVILHTVDSIKAVIGFFKHLIGAFTGASVSTGRIGDRFSFVKGVIHGIGGVIEKVLGIFGRFKGTIDKVKNAITGFATKVGKALGGMLSRGDFKGALDVLNTVILGGFLAVLEKFSRDGLKITGKFSGGLKSGLFGQLGGMMTQVTNAMKSMQQQIKAKTLMRIAEAIAILAAALLVLSLIDSKALTKALLAMSVGFGELVGTMLAMDKILGNGYASVKIVIAAGALILMASAMVIFSAAIKILSTLSWKELAKGLVGVGVGMGILVGALLLITTDTAGLITAGIDMTIIALALRLLANAVKAFSKLSWGELAKGLVGVAAGLVIVIGALVGMPPETLVSAIGVGVMAVSLRLLAGAVKEFAKFSWKDLGKGLLGIAGGLTAIAVGMYAMPPTLPLTALGLIGVAYALQGIVKVIKSLGGMKLGTMAKGIGAMAAALIVLAVGTGAMALAGAGGPALIAVAVGMKIMAGVLKTLGTMKTGVIVKGLLAVAGVFLTLGLAGLLLAPVVPVILALGIALGTIGVGFALFGAGIFLLGKGLEILAKSGAAGAKAFVDAIGTMITGAQAVGGKIADMLVQVAVKFVKGLPPLVDALGKVLGLLLKQLGKLLPKAFDLLDEALGRFIKTVAKHGPDMIALGFDLFVHFLRGLDKNMPEISKRAGDILIKFLTGLGGKADEISAKGTDLLISFLAGIAGRVQDLVDMGTVLLVAFLNALTQNVEVVGKAVGDLIGAIISAIGALAKNIAFAGVGALISFMDGMINATDIMAQKVGQLVGNFITALAGVGTQIADAGAAALVSFLDGLGRNIQDVCDAAGRVVKRLVDCITERGGQIFGAGVSMLLSLVGGLGSMVGAVLGPAISAVTTFVSGITGSIRRVVSAGASLIGGFVGGLVSAVGGAASSLLTMGASLGGNIIDGIKNGLNAGKNAIVGVAKGIGNAILGAVGVPLKVNSPSKAMIELMGSVHEGLIVGLTKPGDISKLKSASSNVGDHVVNSMRDALSKVPAKMYEMGDFNPTITPVLDLTNMKEGAKRLGDLISLSPIAPTVSFQQARLIAHTQAEQAAAAVVAPPAGPTEINFHQTINAPKQLSTGMVYRQTKSLVVKAKEELGIT